MESPMMIQPKKERIDAPEILDKKLEQ